MIEPKKEYKQYTAFLYDRNGEVLMTINYGARTVGTITHENDPIILNLWSQKLKEMNDYLQNLSKT